MTVAPLPSIAVPVGRSVRTPFYAWLGLGILMLFYLLSFLDKQMLSLLANPIGDSMKLSDVELGMLQGIAFSVTYSIGTLAAGVAVDRYSPRHIIFVGIIIWSLAAASGGLAHGYYGLMVSRALVGLGEGVLTPCATAMIVRMFPRNTLGLAIGTYSVGSNIGGIVALLLGGAAIGALISQGGMGFPIIGYREPWQAALIITGLPGVAIAFLVFGIRPWFMRPLPVIEPGTPAAAKTALLPFLRANSRFVLCHFTLVALLGMTAYTLISWSPAYFGRAFGWSHEKIGVVVAIGVAAGAVGNIVWGLVTDRIRRRGRNDAPYLLFTILIALAIPVAIVNFLTGSETLAIALYPLTWILFNSWGSFAGALQLAIPDTVRGRMTAIQTLVVGLLGIGMAPVIVGLVSEMMGGKAHLGEAAATVLAVGGVAIVILLLVGRTAFRAMVDQQQALADA